MRKIIFILITVIIFPSLILAHSNSDISSEDIIRDIMESQNISEKSQINCDEVTDEQFEELGEAVMGVMHPDEKEHELMDQMIGGEGSRSLKSMHIMMGKKYLGCQSSMMGGGMMGGGMMGMMNSGGLGMGNMMSWNNFGWLGWFNWVFIILFLILIILGIIALFFWIINQIRRN